MSTGARKGGTAEINVTPLIDVLLVLLIARADRASLLGKEKLAQE